MIDQAATVCCGDSGGHPGLTLLDDLNLISSAGSNSQLFGAFLYSNACVVAGLHSAARLARQLGVNGSAERWTAFANRIWKDGILKVIASSRSGSPGMVDPESGRFLQARRLSELRGFWTDNPDFLIDHSTSLDITMLGLAVPLGLLPAADSRLTKIAESILRANDALKGDSTVLAHTTYEATASSRAGSHTDQHDISSLATFWMIRYLIQLGRETGHARHWSRSFVMLEGILGRLSQLGLMLRSPGRSMESARQVANPGGTGWRLHSMLIDTILDMAGVDYDAIDRKLFVRPILPGQWPHTGIKQVVPMW